VILDVGGGASTLVDDLARGFSDLTVLDISECAMGERTRVRVLLLQNAGASQS
jgi:hypothetical protein